MTLSRIALAACTATTALVAVAAPAHAGWFSDVFGGPAVSSLAPIGATAAFAGLAWLGRQASGLIAERTQASQASRVVSTLGSVAQGIALTLLQHPPTAAGTLEAVKQAAIAQGVAYTKSVLPDTVAALGMQDATIAARLGNEVAGALLQAPATAAGRVAALAPVVASELTAALTASLAPAAVQSAG